MQYRDRSPCGHLALADAGKEVTLAGWVDTLRDHGEVLFIHLRDRSGIVQVVFTPELAGRGHTPAQRNSRTSLIRSPGYPGNARRNS